MELVRYKTFSPVTGSKIHCFLKNKIKKKAKNRNILDESHNLANIKSKIENFKKKKTTMDTSVLEK